jgi:hypothetical protein
MRFELCVSVGALAGQERTPIVSCPVLSGRPAQRMCKAQTPADLVVSIRTGLVVRSSG